MCRYHPDKKLILNELNVTQVMLKKSLVLLERNSSSVEVLRQTRMVEKRLKKISSMILSNHLNHCILPIDKQKNINESIGKLLETYRLARKYDLTLSTS